MGRSLTQRIIFTLVTFSLFLITYSIHFANISLAQEKVLENGWTGGTPEPSRIVHCPKQSRLSKAIDALLRKKGTTDEDVSNIIDIIELYSTEDTSSADSEARAKENETKDLAKVDAALPESGQAMTHQDVEKSGNPLADGNKHRKPGKPRYPRPLPPRKLPHRGRYETISAKRKEGQVSASLVTPVDNTDRILLKPIGQGTDSNVDVGSNGVCMSFIS